MVSFQQYAHEVMDECIAMTEQYINPSDAYVSNINQRMIELEDKFDSLNLDWGKFITTGTIGFIAS